LGLDLDPDEVMSNQQDMLEMQQEAEMAKANPIQPEAQPNQQASPSQ
jgi:hypothetical protein